MAAFLRTTDATAARDLPTWSPDGAQIAFREKDPDGTADAPAHHGY